MSSTTNQLLASQGLRLLNHILHVAHDPAVREAARHMFPPLKEFFVVAAGSWSQYSKFVAS